MRRQLPSLQSLICFESVAKHLSYTYAAQELFLTQSAVSRQIQKLESYLGVILFTRTRYGVELTEAGNSYAKSIQPHLTALEKSTADLMSHKGLGGTIKIGVVPTFATRWLLPKLHEFTHCHPEITVQLETSTKPFLFHEKLFDAAIFAGTIEQIEHWPAITAHYLMSEILVPVCSPRLIKTLFPKAIMINKESFNLSEQQLLSMPLLQQTTRPSIWQEWFEAMQIRHPNPLGGQRQELFSMLATAAMHDMGMALIPRMLIETELNKGELVIVSQKILEGNRAYYVVHSRQETSHMVKKFTAWVKTYCYTEA